MVTKRQGAEKHQASQRQPAFTTVSLSEVLEAGGRLEAAAYDPEARKARGIIQAHKGGYVPLYGNGGLVSWCSQPYRMKRIYVKPEYGVGLFSSSDINDLNNAPSAYISKKHTPNQENIKIRKWDVMVSRSGTIGNVGFAGKWFENGLLTEDALRLRCEDANTAGFVAAFLRSNFGRLQLRGSNYGSVVRHIEPIHLQSVIVPNIHVIRRSEIGQKFVQAAEYRDDSLDCIYEAINLVEEATGFNNLDLDEQRGEYSKVNLGELGGRLDAGFHSPNVNRVESRILESKTRFLKLGDNCLNTHVHAVTKFRKRIYVEEEGIPLFSSKSIFQVDPIEMKYLGRKVHAKDLKEIGLSEGMVLVTCSGTIGRVLSVPRYMEGWAVNQHALRVWSDQDDISSLIYAWLASRPGNLLVTRNSYGSVIREIDRWMLKGVQIPHPSDVPLAEIHRLVSRANELRTKAWELESTAIAEIYHEI